MKFGILKNESDDRHLNWEKACQKFQVDYQVIDLTSNNWLNLISEANFNGFLACPPGLESLYKQLYDERVYIINKIMGKFVYPNFNEISLHENKKYLSYWLKANKIPLPETQVFYSKSDVLQYIKKADFPIVAKMNIGASGMGVKIFRDRNSVQKYVNQAFTTGIRQSWGPNIKMGGYKNRIINILKNPSKIVKKLRIYQKIKNETQIGFVIFQRYIPHDYEWRVVKIGDSYFGHKKVKQGDKASGTKGINYVLPSDYIMDFVRDLCKKYKFNSMAVDLFEDNKGGVLVNELQTSFGHVQDYICENNGSPGRMLYKKNSWIFEKGNFNTNLSYDLRIENVLQLLKTK